MQSLEPYLGGKLVARIPLRIDRIVVARLDQTLTIFGDNFGDPSTGGGGMVLINGDKVADDKTAGVSWEETRIQIQSPPPDLIVALKDGSIVEVIRNDSRSTAMRYKATVMKTDPDYG